MRNSQLFFFTFLILVVSAFYAQFLDEQAITGKIVSENQCEVQSMKSALRKVLFAFFEDPQQKIISLSKMKDFLRFYLSVPATAVTVDCGGTGSSSGISYASIVSEAENATTTALAPKCSDGTIYGECSATKPLYCYSGNLVQRCETCGCAWSLSCSNNLCVNLTQTTNTTNQTLSYRCIDTDYGQNVYVGGNTGYYKEGSADLLGGWVDRCTSNSTIREAYCASNGSATDTIMSCPANYECRISANNSGDYCGGTQALNETLKCVDSDGDNIYTGGNVTTYLYGSGVWYKETVKTDSCSGTTNITEAYCAGNTWLTKTVSCPAGYNCSYGYQGSYCAQINQTPSYSYRCLDSDNGQNIYTGGNATYYRSSNTSQAWGWVALFSARDVCLGNSSLREEYCAANGSVSNTIMSCPANYECKTSWNNTGDYCGINTTIPPVLPPSNESESYGQSGGWTFKCDDHDDNGNNILVPGTSRTYKNDGSGWQPESSWPDSCYNNYTIREGYCIPGAHVNLSVQTCPANYRCTTTEGAKCTYTNSTNATTPSGTLIVVSTPAGGWAYKDYVYKGQTPLTMEYTGSHAFTIFKRDYAVIRAVFEPANPSYGYYTSGVANYTTVFSVLAGDTKILNITFNYTGQ